MADKTDDLVISISTDLATVRRQLKQLEGLIANAGNNAGRSFTAAGKKMDAALSPVQERINKLTGVGSKGTKEWTGALANQGKELDRLRKKYNPLFAAQQSYLANLRDIKQAHAIGAISAQEMGAAITREKAAFAGIVTGSMGMGRAIKGVGAEAAKSRQLMYQMVDVGQGIPLAFQSPTYALINFGNQFAQIGQLYYGEGGFKSAIEDMTNMLGGAVSGVTGVITKFPLATAAVVAAGAAVGAYAAFGGDDLRSLDDILKEHEENIERLGDAYDKVREKQHKYAADTANTVNALNEASEKELREKFAKKVQHVLDRTRFTLPAPLGIGEPVVDVTAQFKPFEEAIDRLAEQAKNGTSDIKAFRDAVTDIAKTDPDGLNSTRDALLGLSKEAADIEAALPNVAKRVSEVDEAFTQLQSVIDAVKVDSVHDKMQELFDKMRSGETSIKDVEAALNTLSGTNLDLAGPISEMKKLIDKAEKAGFAISKAAVLPTLGTIGPVYSAGGEFIDEGQLQTVRANATKSQYQLAQEKAAKAGRKKGKTDAEKQADAIKRVTDSLKFEIEQLGRSDREQEIYNKLRSAGVEINTKAGRTISELAGKHYDLVEAQKAAKKAQDDFNEGLEQLESDTIDALGNVIAGTEDAADAFKKLAIEIVKSALTGKGAYSDFFASLTGGKLGGGGSILGALFGGLGGGGLSPAVSSVISAGGVGLFASGGISNKPAIFGEGPMAEAAVPLPDGRRIPVDLRMPSIAGRQTSPSATAQVIDINVNVSGARGNTEISQMVERGVRLGIDEFSRRGLPVRVQQIGNDPRARG